MRLSKAEDLITETLPKVREIFSHIATFVADTLQLVVVDDGARTRTIGILQIENERIFILFYLTMKLTETDLYQQLHDEKRRKSLLKTVR